MKEKWQTVTRVKGKRSYTLDLYESKDKNKMQTQIVMFCLDGSIVPSAQPQRLRPCNWEQKEDSQLSLQGR